jgi:hypothetical protein
LDYATERLLGKAQRFMIPVVLGAANYKYFAPPRSYINANDFKNPEELAKYFKFLKSDFEETMSYFWWRNFFIFKPKRIFFCDLCRKLHEPGIGLRSQYYRDMDR